MDSGKETDLGVVEDRILRNIRLLDAVGFTGGEPSLQSRPVVELCRWAKERGLETFLNTNGSNPRLVGELVKSRLLDYVALDVKAPLRPEAYGPVIGLKGNVGKIIGRIMETMRIGKEAGLSMEARTTVVPTLIDDERSIREIARSVRECDLYVIQEFFPLDEVLDPELREEKPPKREFLIKLAEAALQEGVKEVCVRTRQHGMEKVGR